MSLSRFSFKRLWRFRISSLLILVTIAAFWLAVRFNRNSLSVENLNQLELRERIDVDIWKVVWNSDGSRVALVGWEKPVQIHDAVTLWKTRTIGDGKKIIHFAFSPDKDYIAVGNRNAETYVFLASSG